MFSECGASCRNKKTLGNVYRLTRAAVSPGTAFRPPILREAESVCKPPCHFRGSILSNSSTANAVSAFGRHATRFSASTKHNDAARSRKAHRSPDHAGRTSGRRCARHDRQCHLLGSRPAMQMHPHLKPRVSLQVFHHRQHLLCRRLPAVPRGPRVRDGLLGEI